MVSLFCKQCHKQFFAYPSHKRQYCRNLCANIARREHRKKLVCLNCGNIVEYNPSHRTKLAYCSKICQYSHMKLNNSPAWKGGIRIITQPNGNQHLHWATGYSQTKYKGHPYGHLIYKSRARILIECHIERLLKRTEIVWHLNGDTLDDRLQNLYLFPSIAAKNKAIFGFHYDMPTKSNIP